MGQNDVTFFSQGLTRFCYHERLKDMTFGIEKYYGNSYSF